jgi:exopolysaccharide biosynthesis polyprenyl glycosylphosphotransferase
VTAGHTHRTHGARGGSFTAHALRAGVVLFGLMEAITGLRGTRAIVIFAGVLVVSVLAGRIVELLGRSWAQKRKIRVALIGSHLVAQRLVRDLERCSSRYVCVGRIAAPGEMTESEPALAELGDLRHTLIARDIRLLIRSPTAPERQVVDELVSGCLDLHVQLVELSSFYEEVFGFVAISEMNAVWFEYLVDPSYRGPNRLAKRAIDLIGATLLGVPALVLCCILVPLIRRDGDPAVFHQTRIGEAGKPFTLYKLRTMRPESGAGAQWAAIDDPRVTPLGAFLRRTHLDELPQLLNVLHGEMSLVGPRPEQPGVVERLEQAVPFYQRRHLIRPGISGWAQIRCGYARSDSGSLLKHSHDLYYLKNRSIALDLMILAITARLILAGAIRRTEAVARRVSSFEPLPLARQATPDAAPAANTGGGDSNLIRPRDDAVDLRANAH